MIHPETTWPFYLLAILIGLLIPLQASSNALLTRSTGQVFLTAAILFGLAFFCVLIVIVLKQPQMPSLSDLRSAPLAAYSGGFIVAFYVTSITFLVPKIGIANAILFVLCAQIFSASLISHFGLLGVPQNALNPERVLGILIMIFGLFLAKAS